MCRRMSKLKFSVSMVWYSKYKYQHTLSQRTIVKTTAWTTVATGIDYNTLCCGTSIGLFQVLNHWNFYSSRLYIPTTVLSVGLMWYTSFRSFIKSGIHARQQHRQNGIVNKKRIETATHVASPIRYESTVSTCSPVLSVMRTGWSRKTGVCSTTG